MEKIREIVGEIVKLYADLNNLRDRGEKLVILRLGELLPFTITLPKVEKVTVYQTVKGERGKIKDVVKRTVTIRKVYFDASAERVELITPNEKVVILNGLEFLLSLRRSSDFFNFVMKILQDYKVKLEEIREDVKKILETLA